MEIVNPIENIVLVVETMVGNWTMQLEDCTPTGEDKPINGGEIESSKFNADLVKLIRDSIMSLNHGEERVLQVFKHKGLGIIISILNDNEDGEYLVTMACTGLTRDEAKLLKRGAREKHKLLISSIVKGLQYLEILPHTYGGEIGYKISTQKCDDPNCSSCMEMAQEDIVYAITVSLPKESLTRGEYEKLEKGVGGNFPEALEMALNTWAIKRTKDGPVS